MFKECVFSDPPVQDSRFPPSFHSLAFLSGGAEIYGVLYGAQGKGPHPTILILHGFPGNEKNADLAQTFRRAGFNTVLFSYRGAWGSRGSFSFSNVLEDCRIVVEFLRSEEARERFAVDGGRIVLAGHSMGGFAAIKTAEVFPSIKETIFLSGWNIGLDGHRSSEDPAVAERMRGIVESAASRLSGTSVDSLLREIDEKKDAFDLRASVSSFAGRSVLLVGAANDVDVPPSLHHDSLLAAFRGAQDIYVEETILPDDHSYSASRIALAQTMLEFLEKKGH